MPIATNDKGDTVFLDSDGAWKPATLAEHPETKQRLAFDGSTWTPLPPRTTTGEALGRGIMQGASFGFRDEGQGLIEAGGGSSDPNAGDPLTNLGYLARGAYRKLTGDPEAERRYKAAVERERASTKQIEQERPGAYLGGNVLGAVTMPVGFAARAPTFASRIAAGAKTGAAAGALTGFGEGEGLEGSLKGAVIGAPVGGLVGGASVPVVEGLARGAGALASYPVSVARGLLTPGAASERAVGRALTEAERSDPTGINRITQGQFQAGPGDAVVGDVLGEPGRKLARSAANISPEARETMNQALNARGEAQGQRAISWLDNQFSFPNARTQQEALDATRRSATNQAYQAAERQGAGGLWSPELERLASSEAVSGAMRTAVKTSQDEAVRRGMGGFNPKISFTPDNRIQFNRGPTGVPTYPDLRYWDQVRRELSDAAMKAGRGTEENMRLGGLAKALNDELDNLVPAYRTARRTAAGFFDARDALEAGQNFATQKFANEEARAALAGMNATERALFRDGFISRTKDVLGATRDARDITKILGASQESRNKLAIALGPQRAREFQALLHAESIMQKLKEAVQGNSSTVMQLFGAGAAGAAGGGYLGFDPTASGITGALAGGLKKGADANMARHITRLMMSQDPAVLQAGIRQLARNGRNLERLQSLSNALARVTGEQAGERIPGRQAGGPVEEGQPYLVGENGPEVIVPDRPGTVVPQEVQRYLRATTQDYPKFGPGGIPVNAEAFNAAVGGWPESSNVEDRRPERAAAEAQAAREAAAARTGRRGRQEGAGTRFVEGGYGIPAAYRSLNEGARKTFEAGNELTWGADPQAAERAAGTVLHQTLGAAGAPLVAPAMEGAVLGAGPIRRAAIPQVAKQELKAAEAAPTPEAPSGKRQAITATSLRQMPMDEAIAIAQSEQHLIPKKGGGFVGAPYWVKDAQDLARMRADFDAQAVGGVPGANWYGRAQEGNRIMAGPDPARQHLLAGEQALWSAQSTPDTNLGALLSGHNAYEAGKPLEIARTGQQARTYQRARDTDTSIPLGAKTGIYGQHLDPTRSSPTTGTNDIWHARAFNYRTPEGDPWDRALTPQQHAFMDAETVLAVDRANKAKLAGALIGRRARSRRRHGSRARPRA